MKKYFDRYLLSAICLLVAIVASWSPPGVAGEVDVGAAVAAANDAVLSKGQNSDSPTRIYERRPDIIAAPLMDILDQVGTDEKVKALVFMKVQADIPLIDQQLKASKATLAERNRRVIHALKDVSSLTQPAMIGFLEGLKSKGLVGEYRPFWIANMFMAAADRKGIEAIAARDDVEGLYLDYRIENIAPVDTGGEGGGLITSHEIGLDRVGAKDAWAMGYTGQGRTVMNMDSGVDGTHPALSSRFRGDVNGDGSYDESWHDPTDNHYAFPYDANGHGTHTMGTMCGRDDATGDTVGVAIDAEWIAASLTLEPPGPRPERFISDALDDFTWALDPDGDEETQDNPDAINNSWNLYLVNYSVPPCDEAFWVAIDNCDAAGSAVIFSAGNGGSDYNIGVPADRATTDLNCFAVGFVDGYDPGLPIDYVSGRGPSYCTPTHDPTFKPEAVAPGFQVRSCLPDSSYGTRSGTSMAAPHISGAVAILRQYDPNLTVDQIKGALLNSATDLGDVGEDNDYGMGIINIPNAIYYIQGYRAPNFPMHGEMWDNTGRGPVTCYSARPLTLDVIVPSGLTLTIQPGTTECGPNTVVFSADKRMKANGTLRADGHYSEGDDGEIVFQKDGGSNRLLLKADLVLQNGGEIKIY